MHGSGLDSYCAAATFTLSVPSSHKSIEESLAQQALRASFVPCEIDVKHWPDDRAA